MRAAVPGWLQAPRLDGPLVTGLLILLVGGLWVLYSASGGDMGTVARQGARFGVGGVALLALSMVPPRMLRLWAPWLFGIGVLLLAATWFVGVGRNTQRWLDIGVLRFQPSEIMKLAVPMAIAAFLHGRVLPPGWRDSAIALLLLVIPAVLIARQPDLGTALLIASSGAFTLFLSGLSWRLILGGLVAAMAAAPALWLVMAEYQRNRVRTFLDPEADPLGQGWNIIQSKIAVGSGGWTGKGWMEGTQSQLEFIPERHTDFILAVLSEEFGLVGVLAVLTVYLFLIGRGLVIASQARDTFSRLLAGGLSLTLAVYVLVNGGMVSGALPVVGVPLPLVSYGGTSAVTLLAGFGILMSISGQRRFMA